MKDDLFFEYDANIHWPKQDEETIKKNRRLGWMNYGLGVMWMIQYIPKAMNTLNYKMQIIAVLIVIIAVPSIVLGIIEITNTRQNFKSFFLPKGLNFLSIDSRKIIWREGFLKKKQEVQMAEIMRVFYDDQRICIKTKEGKKIIAIDKIKSEIKNKELRDLLDSIEISSF